MILSLSQYLFTETFHHRSPLLLIELKNIKKVGVVHNRFISVNLEILFWSGLEKIDTETTHTNSRRSIS